MGPPLLESGLKLLDRAISDFFRHVDASAGLQRQDPPEEGNEALGVIHGHALELTNQSILAHLIIPHQ